MFSLFTQGGGYKLTITYIAPSVIQPSLIFSERLIISYKKLLEIKGLFHIEILEIWRINWQLNLV